MLYIYAISAGYVHKDAKNPFKDHLCMNSENQDTDVGGKVVNVKCHELGMCVWEGEGEKLQRDVPVVLNAD